MGESRRTRCAQGIWASATRAEDLEANPAGTRVQVVGRDGSLEDDVVTRENERVRNVGNSPSPAATASFNISELIF